MISCQILEEGMQVDFLLEIAPKSGANRLANNSDHRLMIEFGIVEAVEQMNRARSRSGEADSYLAGKLACAVAIKAASSSCLTWIN